jgi:hypothetical protein
MTVGEAIDRLREILDRGKTGQVQGGAVAVAGLALSAIESLAAEVQRLRDERDRALAVLAPFLRAAGGIPDNWPGECVLTFVEEDWGSRHLGYLGFDPADGGPTIADWRRLAALAPDAPGVAGTDGPPY